MTTYGFTDGSLVRKPAAVIRTERNALMQSAFGDDLNISSTSPEGNLIGAETERESLIWELIEAVYKSQWIDTASGASLDNAVAYLGIGRIAARYATATLTLATVETGSDTTVNALSQVQQASTLTLWETLTEVDIPAATNVVTGTITDIEFQSGNTIRYTFSSSFAGVTAGDVLNCTGATFTTNNGLFTITNVSGSYVDVTNLNRSDTAADETTVTLDGVITDGIVTVSAQTTLKGLYTASQGSIETISNPVSGWDYVSNFAEAEAGRNTETDTELRARAKAATASSRGGTIEGIKARLLALDSVTYVAMRENRTDTTDGNGLPPHSIEAVLLGGDDQDIGDLLYLIKGAGINTYGTSSVNATDDFGVSQVVYFSRPTPVPIFFIVNVTKDATYPATGDADIKAAMVTYGATLVNGDDVLNYKFIDAIASITGLLTIEILQGLSDPPTLSTNLAMSANEIAQVTTANIVVNAT